MDEDKKDMPDMQDDMQDCGCHCEKCMAGTHDECPTGMCQKKTRQQDQDMD